MTIPQQTTDDAVSSATTGYPEHGSSARGFFSWHVVVLFLVAAVALFSRFFRQNTLGFFEDDFFYYVQAAKMLVVHGVSSFDGTHLTNGYHPLWFLIIAALYRLFPVSFFFVAVQTVSILLLLWFYASALRIFQHLSLTDGVARSAALLLSLQTVLLFRYGMEVTVSLPFGMAMLSYVLRPDFRWTARQTFLYGLLACFTVLGRLDASLLVALLIVSETLISTDAWTTRLRRIGIFSIAFIPFFLYLFINHHWFHSLLPVSGHAKQLKPLLPPSDIPLTSLFLPFDFMKMAFVYPGVALLCIGIGRFLQVRRILPARERTIYIALFSFPIVYLGTLSFLSDWTLWPWYFYALVYSSVATLLLLLRPHSRAVRGLGASATSVTASRLLHFVSFLYIAYIGVYAVQKRPRAILLNTAEFTLHHPGIYAMGDGAGTVAYLSNQPFIQLEGLMMDADYLNVISRRTPVAQALDHYHVRYYGLLTMTPNPPDHCFTLVEPNQAGPASPRMTGRVCSPPLASFGDRGVYVLFFDAATVQ